MEQIWERLEMKTGFRFQESHETTEDGQRRPKTILDPNSFRSIKGNKEVEYLESRLGIEKELEFEFKTLLPLDVCSSKISSQKF